MTAAVDRTPPLAAIAVLIALLRASSAYSATPTLEDYAQGALVQPATPAPMIEVALPDALYQSITRADLADVRVFNAEGAPVAHAFCAPVPGDPVVTQHALPVFRLRQAQQQTSGGDRIEVETSGGSRLELQEGGAGSNARVDAGGAHIVDARSVDDPLRAVEFDWSSPDGASEVDVRIEASDDLDRWRVVAPASTLLQASQDGRELRRRRIELPLQEYEYLRVERIDRGPPLDLQRVSVESVAPALETAPAWFTPDSLASATPNIGVFDTTRLAPVRYARIRPQQENTSLRATLESRPDERSPWRERWSGEVYLIANGTERRESAPARFDPTPDRFWRLLLSKESGAASVSLELGYRPAQLRFLAQGGSPYMLAYGSRRAAPATPAPCEGLLQDVAAEERRELTAEGYVTDYKVLGGPTALQPAPKRTPVRVIVLWAVLVIGVALLVAMALSLLKRVKHGEQ